MNFNNPYNRANFLKFLEERFLPDDFKSEEEKYENFNFTTRYTVDATKLGTCQSMELDVFEITHTSTHDARVGIAQDAFRLMLNKSYNNRALVIFKQEGNSQQYRFSLLQIEAEQKIDSSRITRSFSNPRRYSFILGENAHVKTPTQFLLEKGPLTKKDGNYFNDLQERFSVEVLTKLFYKELSDWYFWALKHAEFPNCIDDDSDDKIYNPENIIRLITRLIFVWFLKQKGLVIPELFDTNKLKKFIKNFDPVSENQGTYYKAILQNLFFATLNQEIGKRGFAENKSFFENKSKNYNIKNLYRYEEFFVNKNTTEIMKLFSQIPFLNGGLFECLDEKKVKNKIYYWDGFSRVKKRQAFVPNNLFFSQEQTVDLSSEYNNSKMKAVKVSGIIEILKKYNFTIEENTPIDIHVALDPELLGKVFENLLGAFNPETQETARNQTGSFYTPREIVNFMVNESLLAYYISQVPDISEDKIRPLFDYGQKEVELNETQKKALIKATFNCKILDPACGSGAFPMGVLQQLVHVLTQLDPNNQYWQELVIEQALEAVEKAKISTNEEKEKIIKDVYLSFDRKINYPDYARKLFLIENCIYGTDIQPIATQISKLRFFISLICEQKPTNNVETNFGIRPLPNLETKFISTNTLIAIEKPDEYMQYINTEQIKKLINELRDIRHKLFSVTNVKDKTEFRKKDEQIRKYIVDEVEKIYKEHTDEKLKYIQMEIKKCSIALDLYNKKTDDIKVTYETDLFGNTKETKINVTENKRIELASRKKRLEAEVKKLSDYPGRDPIVKLAEQLTKWDPYEQNIPNDFFDPEWMFGIDGGFDIVIGNPPYFSLTTDSPLKDEEGKNIKHNKLYENCNYLTFKNNADIYCLFYERGWQLLNQGGHLCYITSNKWMRAGFGEAIRKFFAEHTNPKKLIDFGGIQVFESATVDTNILLFAKENNTFKTQACVIKGKKLKKLSDYFRQHQIETAFSNSTESWVVLSQIERQIKEKIERVGTPLKDWDIQINYGIKTGFNEAFIIDGKKRQELINQDPKSAEIIRPILRGRDIKRYSYDFADLWLINTHNGIKDKGIKPININDYPAVKKHLDKYYPKLEKRQDKGDTPYNLRNCAYIEDFYKQKIMYSEIVREPQFYLDNTGEIFPEATTFILTGNHLEYLCNMFNSKTIAYAFKTFYAGGGLGESGYRYKKAFFEKLPIPKFSNTKIQQQIKNAQITDNIECLIYKLLEFNDAEIDFIQTQWH
jgi:hypothetical protein